MPGLLIDGEPQGWLDAGYAINVLAARLDTALADAAFTGAAAAERGWYGPAATAFSASWAAQRDSNTELMDLVRRAASAITAYGQALAESHERARALEYAWCAAGLVVGADGFLALPEGVAALPTEVRNSLERALGHATRDVENLNLTAAEAVSALLVTLGPVATLLEEFGLAGFGAAFIAEYGREFAYDLASGFKDIAGDVVIVAGGTADVIKKTAASKRIRGDAKGSGRVLSAAGFVLAGAETFVDARHQGSLTSIEDHAGALVSSFPLVGAVSGAAGDFLADAALGAVLVGTAPEIAVAIGGVVIGAVIAAGVGAAVQVIVDHNRARINNVVHDIESIF